MHLSGRRIAVKDVVWTYLEGPASCVPMATIRSGFAFGWIRLFT
jgi:hypothetical protein